MKMKRAVLQSTHKHISLGKSIFRLLVAIFDTVVSDYIITKKMTFGFNFNLYQHRVVQRILTTEDRHDGVKHYV